MKYLLAILAITLLIVAGCSSSAPKTPSSNPDKTAPADVTPQPGENMETPPMASGPSNTEPSGSDHTSLRDKVSDARSNATDSPELVNWPKDIPIMPEMTVINENTIKSPENPTMAVRISAEAKATADEVTHYYKGLDGWTVQDVPEPPGFAGSILSMTKGSEKLTVMAQGVGAKVTVTLSWEGPAK